MLFRMVLRSSPPIFSFVLFFSKLGQNMSQQYWTNMHRRASLKFTLLLLADRKHVLRHCSTVKRRDSQLLQATTIDPAESWGGRGSGPWQKQKLYWEQWRSQRGLGGSNPSTEKGVHFYYLVIEQNQWLIIKIVDIRCRILRLKRTKFRFRLGQWGSVPDPAGELTALPQTPQLDLIRGPTSEGKEDSGREKGSGKGIKGEGARTLSITNFWLRH